MSELEPRPGELVVRKTQASAFFEHRPRTVARPAGGGPVVVTGCTTSGCVRAERRRRDQLELPPDRRARLRRRPRLAPHEANLFDMEQKYADVLDRDRIIAALGENE